jgi:hypothetical protein
MKKRLKSRITIALMAVVLALVGGLAVNQALNPKAPEELQLSVEPAGETEPVKQEAVAVDPCVLFDIKDIESIFKTNFEVGLAIEKEQTPDKLPATECEYRQANDGSVESLAGAYSLKILIENYNSAESARTETERLKSQAESGEVPYEILAVEGFEPETFFYTPTTSDLKKTQETLVISKGPQIFKFTIFKQNGIEKEAERTHLQELADTKF